MKALLIALALVAAACGSGEITSGSTATTTTEPEPTQLELLTEARALWEQTRPEEYVFRYNLICECVPGPWTMHVKGSRASLVAGPSDHVPYQTIDGILDEITRTLEAGEIPVLVEYSGAGYPVSYIFNVPGLPVDAGYIVKIESFEGDPDLSVIAIQEAELETALTLWNSTGLSSYDYVVSRGCFCPQEFIGPYDGSVTDGEIVRVTFEGVDTAEMEFLKDRSYAEVAPDVDALFEIVRGAIRQADQVTVAYDPALGYPTAVSIDWILNAVDDEESYQFELLGKPVEYPESCSTEGWDASLGPQPGLPEAVAATRLAIFEAAMNCDFAGLVALSEVGELPLETDFGGSGPEKLWERESQGVPLLQVVVQHLNLPFAASGDGDSASFYVWPSAMYDLTSPYGHGLPADEYEALLELYTVAGLEEMFDGIGGYVGWQHVIAADGEWLFFIAGD